MKRLVGCLVLLALAFSAGGALAAVDPTKYTQPPEQDLSYDLAASIGGGIGYVMAEDWVCTNSNLPVTDIHWWGSYWAKGAGLPVIYSDMLPNAASGGIQGFTVAIYGNAGPDAQFGFNRPTGAALWSGYYPNTCGEAYRFRVTKQTDAGGNPTIWEDVYEYGVYLKDGRNASGGPSAPTFQQQQGNRYWLAIFADLPDTSKQWGWHEADGNFGRNAVQRSMYSEAWGDWYIPCGGRDLAFELTTVPEPSSVVALGTGLMGLVGFVLRKRR